MLNNVTFLLEKLPIHSDPLFPISIEDLLNWQRSHVLAVDMYILAHL
jgi:hypothetical protein